MRTDDTSPRIEHTASAERRPLPETVGTKIVEAKRADDLERIYDNGVGAVFFEDDKFGSDEKFADEYFFNTHRDSFTRVLGHALANRSTSDTNGIKEQLNANVKSAINAWKILMRDVRPKPSKATVRALESKIQAVADDLHATLTRFRGYRIGEVSLEVEEHTETKHTGRPGMHIDDGNSHRDPARRALYNKRHLVVTRTYFGKSTVISESGKDDGSERKTPNGSTVAFWGGVGGTLHSRPKLELGQRRFVAVIRLLPE